MADEGARVPNLGSANAEEAAPLRAYPGLQLGRVVLVERLARGGMGELWLAGQPGITGGRPVAIKLLRADRDDGTDAAGLFLDEARIGLELNHQNIVSVYDVGVDHGLCYIVMELLRGQNLSSLRRRHLVKLGKFPPELAARIVADACRGLHYAHQRRDHRGQPLEIVHRDVSPQNVMVTYSGEVKVIDFGIALAAERLVETSPGLLRGKAHYMSPEQARGEALDPRSDVFSAGLLLYELLVGRPPLEDKTSVQALWVLSAGEVDPPIFVEPTVPPLLNDIVIKALTLDPDERYPTAEAFQLALEGFIRGAGMAAGSTELAERLCSLFREEQERTEAAAGRARRELERTQWAFAHKGGVASAPTVIGPGPSTAVTSTSEPSRAETAVPTEVAHSQDPAVQPSGMVPTPVEGWTGPEPATIKTPSRDRRWLWTLAAGGVALTAFGIWLWLTPPSGASAPARVAADRADAATQTEVPGEAKIAREVTQGPTAPDARPPALAATRPRPRRLGKVTVIGDLDPAVAEAALLRASPQLRRCLQSVPKSERPDAIEWVISGAGRPMTVRLKPSDRSPKDLAGCMESVVDAPAWMSPNGGAFSVLTLELDSSFR